jgi:hypothetical protein
MTPEAAQKYPQPLCNSEQTNDVTGRVGFELLNLERYGGLRDLVPV